MSIINRLYLILVCALIGFATCEQNTFIKSITPSQVRNVGEEVTFNCTFENPNNYTVTWLKKSKDNPSGSSILSFNMQLSSNGPKFNLTATPNSNSFHIRNIEYADAGLYVFQMIISERVSEAANVELSVRHPPKIAQVIEITPPVASLNGSAELKCKADGYPRPSISWIRENNGILPSGGDIFNGSILKITEVSEQDRGLYYCIADNGIEPADKRSVNFEVEFAPKIFVSRPRVAQALGYDIDLECRVEGFPSPSIVWLKNDAQLYDDSDQSITTTASLNSITTSVLRVNMIKPDQFGNYECKAQNKLGSAKETVNLFESSVAVYPWKAMGRI